MAMRPYLMAAAGCTSRRQARAHTQVRPYACRARADGYWQGQ